LYTNKYFANIIVILLHELSRDLWLSFPQKVLQKSLGGPNKCL